MMQEAFLKCTSSFRLIEFVLFQMELPDLLTHADTILRMHKPLENYESVANHVPYIMEISLPSRTVNRTATSGTSCYVKN